MSQKVKCNIVPSSNGQGINMSLVNVGNPIGTIITYVNSSTLPDLYMECDGSEIERDLYADLFTLIGTTFGVGDGSTTFNLPDLRGEFIRGFSHGRSGVDVSRTFGSFQNHAFTDHTHTYAIYSASQAGANVVPYGAGYYYNVQTGLETSGALSGSSTETRPRNIALIYLIKVE